MRAETAIEWPAGNNGKRVMDVLANGAHGPLLPFLIPLEQLYSGAIALRNRAFDSGVLKTERVAIPVISIGNIIAGGAGKTPVTRWLTAQLLARARRPAILHGGYGSDEPRLHQQWHPDVIIIAERDRVAAARVAIERGADVILLDDGFQHRRLARDLDIVLLPAEAADAHLLPRGPGREPMRALKRSSCVLITRKTATPETALLLETKVHKIAPGVPTGRVHLRLTGSVPTQWTLVVASIARPDLFLTQLEEHGARITAMLAYPDHFDYSPSDAKYIIARAGNKPIITTGKDAVKLQSLLPKHPLHVADQVLVFESGAGELMAAVDNVL
jgi:tetraacyldisaccharide 4'-kinase